MEALKFSGYDVQDYDDMKLKIEKYLSEKHFEVELPDLSWKERQAMLDGAKLPQNSGFIAGLMVGLFRS